MNQNKIKIYLDNCCYNRPFDDQTYLKINLEAQAKLQIQTDIKNGKYDLVWSYISDYELSRNPFPDRKAAIEPWRGIASDIVREESQDILEVAEMLKENGIKAFDALHISCAKNAGCDYFITTDKQLLRVKLDGLTIVNPLQFVVDMEESK